MSRAQPFGRGGTPLRAPAPPTIVDAVNELRIIRRIIIVDILTRATGNLASAVNAAAIDRTGTSGSGTRLYRNDLNRPIAVVIRSRGGLAQTLFVAKNDLLRPSQGFLTSGVSGVTADSQAILLKSGESVYGRLSSTAATVDVHIFDPLGEE